MPYAFSAWIDERGSNMDSRHIDEQFHTGRCPHLRLWDLNRRDSGYNVIRIVRRKRPLYLHVMVGRNYRTALRVGRKRVH